MSGRALPLTLLYCVCAHMCLLACLCVCLLIGMVKCVMFALLACLTAVSQFKPHPIRLFSTNGKISYGNVKEFTNLHLGFCIQ